MAEEEKATKEAEAPEPKKSKKKLIIIIAAVVILLGGGAGFYLTQMKGGDEVAEGADAHGETKKDGGGHGEEGEGGLQINIIEFKPFIVNLLNTSGNRYLKVTINMEVEPAVLDEAEQRRAQIRDSIIILLSSKSFTDVGSVQGKYQLRDEIAARTNMALTTGRVKSVYFTEFVIQ